MLSNQVKGGLYGCISAVSYGMNPLCALYLYQDGINSNSVLFYRFLIGTLVLGAVMGLQRKSFALTRREAAVLGLLGAIFAISSLTYFLSFHYMPAGVAATLVFAYPVFVAILMALFFGERLKWPSLVAIALTMGGIGLLYEGDNRQPIALAGILLIAISALSYALYIIVINRSGIVMSSVKLTFYAMLSCLCCITAYAVCSPTSELQMLHGAHEWFFAVLLGLVPTVVSLVFMAMAIRCIGSTPTAIMGALEPVTAVVFGVTLFGESLTLRLVSGVLLILLSVMLIILDSRLRRALAYIRVSPKGHLLARPLHLMKKYIRWR